MPSKHMAKKDKTYDQMSEFMVSDLRQAFFEGVSVAWIKLGDDI